jgi:hypothetical protein
VVADRLAALNYEVYEALRESRGLDKDTVGPRSIVVWRRRLDARQGPSGGGHLFYTGTTRDREVPGIPSIMKGNDLMALVGMFTEMVTPLLTSVDFEPGKMNLDADEMNRRLAALPDTPDDKLR